MKKLIALLVLLASTAASAHIVIGVGIPAPLYVQPAPVYVQPQPYYEQPPQVYVAPPPVYVQPSVSFGIYHHYGCGYCGGYHPYHPYHYRRW